MIEKVLKLWHDGYSEYEIAERFEVSVHTIKQILINNGVYY